MPPDPRVSVGVGAVVRPDHARFDRVLMIRRVGKTGFAADGRDTWSVPGGWLDRGEMLGECAEREVLEETGCRVRAVGQIGAVVCESQSKDISIVTVFVVCDWVMGEPRVTEPDKCEDVGWLTWQQVQDGRPLFAPLREWLRLAPQGVIGL